ncbi:MAG: SGNH/GDSL hydrolase family protein [Tepidisphaerales bacterium]
MKAAVFWKSAGGILVLWIVCVAALLTVHTAAESVESPATLPAVGRILFLGNSITRHGPKPDIGWTGDWGMAASAVEKDYVHVLASTLAARTGTAPEVLVENIADFERTPDTFDFKARLEKSLAFKAEIIVLAIGENVPVLRTDAAKAAFREHFKRLLAAIRGREGTAVFVRSCFWPDAAKDEILRQVSAEMGAVFVDISALGRDPANQARAERQITHDGVAAHPGDKGMKAIADALLKAINDRAAARKESK